MPNKKLLVSATNALSETTQQSILNAASVQNGAAKIVRDANGKVVEVVIHLPDTASDAAAAAIAATPGVSNVEVTDLPMGTQGTDGTQSSLDNLVAEGFSVSTTLPPPTNTENPDGSITISPSGSNTSAYWIYNGSGKCPSSPLPLEVEMKIKNHNVAVHVANDVYSVEVGVDSTSVFLYTPNHLFVAYTTPTEDNTYHIYKMTISDTGLAVVTIDAVQVLSQQLTAVYDGNYVKLSIGTSNTINPTIDYVRWTKRP